VTGIDRAPEAAVEKPVRRPLRLRVPVVRQHSEMDCGAACLATVCAYWGRRFSLNRMRDHARVGREGASLANLRRAAKELGFTARPREVPVAELTRETLPAIGNWKGYHWIVIYAVGARSVLVADPAFGLRRIPRGEFEKDFTGYCLLLRPERRFYDQPHDRSPLRGITHHFREVRGLIFEVFLASLAVQLIAVAMPLFTKFLIDDIIMQGEERWLWAAVLGVGGAMLMQLLMSWVRMELAFAVASRSNLSIVRAVYTRLIHLPMSYFSARKAGDVTSRLEEQAKVTTFVSETVPGLIIDVMSAVIYLSIMLWFSPFLAGVAGSFVLIHILVARIIAPRLRLAFAEAFEKGAEQESHVLETLRGIETIKSTGAGPFVRWRFDDLYAGNANLQLRIERISTIAGVAIETVGQAAAIAVLFLGALLVFDGEMSIGVLVAFTMFAAALFKPLENIVAAWDEYQETQNAVERLNDILDKAPEFEPFEARPDLLLMPRPRGAISFSRVGFRYHPDDRSNVLQNISLDIGAGEKVAFVGRSGCGKSTILKLVFGLNAPTDGDIRIDGFDTRDIWLPSLRRHIGCVPQKATIFAGTVLENIALARPDASRTEVAEALRLADAEDFVAAMPGGLEARLSEQGSNLSGGQRQRIALARLFLQDPAILLLDEATSALDTAGEKRVMTNIAERFSRRTILVVAHRLSTIRNADRIVVLNRGLVAEEGTHERLIAADGLYQTLQSPA